MEEFEFIFDVVPFPGAGDTEPFIQGRKGLGSTDRFRRSSSNGSAVCSDGRKEEGDERERSSVLESSRFILSFA